MTRIKQFANDMGLTYNEAKGLVAKGRKKKDGGSTVLEKFMSIEIVPKRKTDRARSKTRMKDKMNPTPRQKEKEKQAKQSIKKQSGGGLDEEFRELRERMRAEARARAKPRAQSRKERLPESMRKTAGKFNLDLMQGTGALKKEDFPPKEEKKKSKPKMGTGTSKMRKSMPRGDITKKMNKGGSNKVTRINKDKSMQAKAGQFKNIVNASTSGGISPEEALKKIRKLVISKKDGGALKDLPSASENPGLRKLPTEVRNKMGYKKKGGTMKTTPKSRDMFKERTQFLFGKEITDVEKSNQEVLKRANKARADAEKKAKGMMGGGTYNMMPRKMSKGGVARGTGAAVKGTGFKGVY